jgi:hypothetical protein
VGREGHKKLTSNHSEVGQYRILMMVAIFRARYLLSTAKIWCVSNDKFFSKNLLNFGRNPIYAQKDDTGVGVYTPQTANAISVKTSCQSCCFRKAKHSAL